MQTQYVDLNTAPELKRIVLAAFGDYRKHKAGIGVFHPMSINSYWDGGSKDTYRIVDLTTGRSIGTPSSSHPYFDVTRAGLAHQETDVIAIDHVGNVTLKILPVGYALVRSGIFCGKPATACVYVNAENLTPALTNGGR